MKTPLVNCVTAIIALATEPALFPQGAFADALDSWTSQTIAINVAGGFRDVAFGNGRYVIVGDSPCTPDYGIVATSDDGNQWTLRHNGCTEYPGSLNELLAITYGANQFVAVGYFGSIYNSTDGITWIQRTQAPFYNFNGVTFGNGKFVAVGDGQLISGGTTNRNIYTSVDGTNWVARSLPVADNLGSIAFNGTVFVATGTGDAYRSSLGTSWTAANTGPFHSGRITFCNGFFIIPAGIGTNLVSTDGAVWNVQTNDSPVAFTKVVYEHGIYLAVGTTNAFFTSTNGTNWIARHFPTVWNDFYAEGVTLAGSKAVAVAFTRNGMTFYSIALTSEQLVDVKAHSLMGQLGIFGITGASYRIEYVDTLGSSDNVWHPLASFSLPISPYVWSDVTASTANSRFYRAVLLP